MGEGEQGGLQPGQWEGKCLLKAESETAFSPACPGYATNGLGHCSPGQKPHPVHGTHTNTNTHKHFVDKHCANKVSLRVYASDFYERDIIKRETRLV